MTHVTSVEKTHPHLCSRPSESPWPGKSLPQLPPQKGPVRGLLIYNFTKPGSGSRQGQGRVSTATELSMQLGGHPFHDPGKRQVSLELQTCAAPSQAHSAAHGL